MSHILMTAKDVADVALDWCTDDDIYGEEQKYESSEKAVVAAIVQSTPAALHFRSRGHQ